MNGFSELQGNQLTHNKADNYTVTYVVLFMSYNTLAGSNGPKKFTIKKFGAINSLPCAHTW